MKRFFLSLISFTLILNILMANALFASPMAQSDLNALNNYNDWVAAQCNTSDSPNTPVVAGTGTPTGLSFPSLDPTAMATSIDNFITKTNPSSKMVGLGSVIVASAKNSNVSPFLIVAFAHHESSLANPSDFNVQHGNNSFGRTATSSQPNFQGSHLWYYWSSIKASVDYTATENQNAIGGGDQASYLRAQFGKYIDSGASIFTILSAGGYAPATDGNDPNGYSAAVTADISAMASGIPSSSTAAPASTSTSTPGTSGVVWPFSTKSATQYQRIDEGWDIQTFPGGGIYAIAPGTIKQLSPDPGGFGNDYPVESLDSSIGGPSDWIYYGHVHVIPSVVNQHVTAGQLIAYSNKAPNENGSAAPAGWLEIGFAKPSTDAPFDSGSGTTSAGQAMHDILVNANAGVQTGTVSPGSGNASCSSACSTGSGGSLDKFLQAIALHESGGIPIANSHNGAYGKYQFIPSTWQGYAKKYYPPGQQWATADLAPENIQDAVAYLANISVAKQFKNDPFWMAINWYQPSATKVYPNKSDPSLNVAPPGNGGLTYASYGNQIDSAVQTGTLQGKGPINKISLNYSAAPDFASWLAKAGGAPDSQTASSSNGCGGAGVANFVFYDQCDPKWANAHYDSSPSGKGTICANGCGATSVAMIVATLSDKSVTPVESANYSMSIGGYISGAGTSFSYFAKGPEHWGLKTTQLGTDMSKAISVLQGGGLVIAGGNGAAPFTTGGHVIVLKGIASNGDILVGDPFTQHKEKQYPASVIQSSGVRNMVGVTK
ncbi:MAG: C39 family peptidase [Candidatus Saccharibacteria bacterium]